ncbi:PREDICTED: fractalkine [Galeopterus variegatus]|uniref:Fractalkine n=1 Tax=Galeopterus variegatus TaxID=482537 RepID=A0ABM0QX55_GALVR|nr:PREDICTED: fractalkine [Galeopterus variegatus]
MAPMPFSWLLRFAALCHLTILLAGQHFGVTKCNITCNKMTSEIPVTLLVHYQRNQESCGKSAIILTTKKERLFCADPNEEWVQKAMQYLNQQAAALAQNSGTFEKQIGVEKPSTTTATRGVHESAVSKPKDTWQSNSMELTSPSQEAQKALGTSLELPVGVAGSSGTRAPSILKAQNGGPPSGPEGMEIFNMAAVSTAIAWQSSAAYQPGSGLWAEGKASEAPSTEPPSTQTPTTEPPSTQIPSTEPPSTQIPSTEPPSIQTPTRELSPRLENSLGPEEMGPVPAHTDALQDWGPGSMTHASVVPVSSKGIPSREPVASASRSSKAEEPIHATVDPQRLGVLITPVPDSQVATRRQAVGLLAFLGLLFGLGVAMFAYHSLQGCPSKMAGEVVEGLRYVPRGCGSNSYVLVPV